MTKLEAIAAAKTFRQQLDITLQSMKAQRTEMCKPVAPVETPLGTFPETQGVWGDDQCEAIAQHTLAIRDAESAIMRLGMSLKYIGNPNPYPESYNPSSPVVEPTADGLKL